MKSKDHYESISARKYANGALEHAKTGKTNNSLIMRDWYRGEKRRARLSKPRKTRRVEIMIMRLVSAEEINTECARRNK